MSQPDADSEAVDRLKREIARDRARLASAKQIADTGEPADEPRIGRLYKIIEAMGQAQ